MPDGYYDEQGTFIPGSFADQLDLPGPTPVDTGSAAALQQQISTLTGQTKASQARIQTANHQAQLLKKKLASKGLSLGMRKLLTAQLRKQQQIVTAEQKTVTANTAALPGLQTKYYETTGQYEQLLTGANRDAFASLQALFNSYGLGTLAPKIYEFAKQGYGADVISLLLQDTEEYKTRFAGNQARQKAGLPVLSPAEYLATEDAYRQVLQDAGLPKGFYDSPTDFTKWIAGDTSPTEVKGRVDLAVANTMQANPAAKQALQQLYGVDNAHIVAFYLDEKRALPILQKQSQAAAFGGEALKRGLGLNVGNLEDFVTAGLSQSQVSQGFQAVAEALPNIAAIAARYGENITQSELEQDIIGGTTGLGETKRKRLASQERALFGGYAGASPGGLSTGFQQT